MYEVGERAEHSSWHEAVNAVVGLAAELPAFHPGKFAIGSTIRPRKHSIDTRTLNLSVRDVIRSCSWFVRGRCYMTGIKHQS